MLFSNSNIAFSLAANTSYSASITHTTRGTWPLELIMNNFYVMQRGLLLTYSHS